MKKILSLLLCGALCLGFMVMPVAADFNVTYYNEEIYAGGILDMLAFVGESDISGYTFQWQTDAGFGEGHWYDLEDNAYYKGTKTNHLQFYSVYGQDYTEWAQVPFRCVVTKNGVTKYTPNLYMRIRSSDGIVAGMQNKGLGLHTPNLSNVTGFTAKDDLNYTANAYAGSNIHILCSGSTEDQISTLKDSDVQLKREIKITENGKTVTTVDNTSYIPYTVGRNAVKIEVNMRIIMAGVDRGIYQTKTVQLTTKKPEVITTAKTKAACSLLRYTYNESEKLASISKGVNLEVTGKQGSYYQVVYNGLVGYVGTSVIDVDMTESRIIDHVDLTMAEPSAGNVAPSSLTVRPSSCFATSVEWYDKTSSRYLDTGDRFILGHDYQVVIWVSAKEGYQFKLDSSDNMQTTALINDKFPCYTYCAYEQVIGKVIDIRFDFHNVQEAEPATPTQPQDTPTQPQVSPTQPSHTHTPSAWRTTGAYHYKVCTVCGDMLGQEDHLGGVATCVERGRCTVCNYTYLETTEDHIPDTSKWVYRGNMYHFHPCKLCGAHCDIADHVAGPAGTPDDAVVCKDCGYILTPAKDHVHDLSKVPRVDPTCTLEGNIEYYACTGCMDCFTDPEGKHKIPETETVMIAPLGHKASEDWKCDAAYHWRACTACQELLSETQMLHELQDGICMTCGYGSIVTPDATEPSQSATTPSATVPSNADDASAETTDLSWLLLIGVCIVGLAVGATIVILLRKKK